MMAAQQLNHISLGDLVELDNPLWASIAVSGLQLDSRRVTSGDLFFACRGAAADGRRFIDQAIAAGASVVLVDHGQAWQQHSERSGVPLIVVKNLTHNISSIADRFYKRPSQRLSLLGVTGTNAKTTCTQLLSQLLNKLDKRCGVIGTLGTGVDGEMQAGVNTTPDAVSIQRLLAQWCDEKILHAAMEVSSHGLDQGRVAALQFKLALFTNLSRDHLDYHGSMEAYGRAKAKLFQQPGLEYAVLNADDPFSQQLQGYIADDVQIIQFSTRRHADADVWLEDIQYHSSGVSAQLHSRWGSAKFHSQLLGEFNLSNLVAVLSCLGALGYPLQQVVDSLPAISPVTGRMELLPEPSDIRVVVDYAHTPDALEKALQAVRQHCQGELWCVFGCGGDRDQGKRAQMGAVAQRDADHVMVSSDNPRYEAAGDIIDHILAGIDEPGTNASILVEPDRALAIARVIAEAKPGDMVLIAGKGHEHYQIIGDQQLPFSDVKQARLALAKRSSTDMSGGRA